MKKHYLSWNFDQSIDQIVESLNNGHVILGDSDTVLGLLAPATKKGRLALDLIKNRDQKPYIILIENIQKASLFVDEGEIDKLRPLLEVYWPGPLTVICKAKSNLDTHLQGPDGTVALRVPDHAGLQAVLKHVDGLFSTSANLSGQSVAGSINEVDDSIKKHVSLIVLDEVSGAAKVASTILDCSGPKIRLVREGAYKRAALKKNLGNDLI